jgi:hypothetical protein
MTATLSESIDATFAEVEGGYIPGPAQAVVTSRVRFGWRERLWLLFSGRLSVRLLLTADCRRGNVLVFIDGATAIVGVVFDAGDPLASAVEEWWARLPSRERREVSRAWPRAQYSWPHMKFEERLAAYREHAKAPRITFKSEGVKDHSYNFGDA